MKTRRLFIFSLVAVTLLSACTSSKPTETATPPLSAADIYTAVASTLTAQATSATEEPTALPTEIPTIPYTDTPAIMPTDATVYSYQTMTPASTISACDNSIYVSDVTIPDGTVLAPGQNFTKTWMLQNSGSCTWSTSYSMVFVSGSQMSGVSTNLTNSVAPSQQIDISVAMIAPSTEGTYTGFWRLYNTSGAGFGSTVWVKIVVSNSAGTYTPTPTETLEYTYTPSSTPTITNTPTITYTPTITNTPTDTHTPKPTKTPTPSKTPKPTST